MTLQELNRLVTLGEGLYLEFKRRVPHDERIAKEVIALANTHGGRLLLGVGDDGTIYGVPDAIEEEFVLRRALDTFCSPKVEYTTERIRTTDGSEVILVFVPESIRKPHFLVNSNATGDGTAYVRAGEMSVEASAESVRLMKEEGAPQGARFEFGEKELLLMRYLEDYAHVTVPQFAQLAGISHEEASQILVNLTRANILRLQADRGDDYFTLALPEE